MAEFRASHDIAFLLWRMRLGTQKTLEHYLQEVVARSIITTFPPESRNRIKALSSLYPVMLRGFLKVTA